MSFEAVCKRTATVLVRQIAGGVATGSARLRPFTYEPRRCSFDWRAVEFRPCRTSRQSLTASGKSPSLRATRARTLRESPDRWRAQARWAQARARVMQPRSSAARADRRWRSAACSTASTRRKSVWQRWQQRPPWYRALHVGQRSTQAIPGRRESRRVPACRQRPPRPALPAGHRAGPP